MLEVLQSPDQVAAIAISGTLTGDDYDRIIAEVEAKLARHERIGALLDLARFEDFTAEAAWRDLRYDLSKLFELKRFPRADRRRHRQCGPTARGDARVRCGREADV